MTYSEMLPQRYVQPIISCRDSAPTTVMIPCIFLLLVYGLGVGVGSISGNKQDTVVPVPVPAAGTYYSC